MEERQIELIDFIRVCWRQKWIIIVTIVVAVVTAWLLSEVPVSTYRSTSSVLLMPSLASELDAVPTSNSLSPQGYEKLAISTSVLFRVLETADVPDQLSLKELLANLSVSGAQLGISTSESTPKPVLLRMALRGYDVEDLASITQAWIDAFTAEYEAMFEDSAARSHSYILENYHQTEADLRRAAQERVLFLSEHPVAIFKAELATLALQMNSLQLEIQAAELELNTLDAHPDLSGLQSQVNPSAFTPSDTISPYTLSGALLLGIPIEQLRTLLSARIGTLSTEVGALRADLLTKQATLDSAEAEVVELDRRLALLTETAAFLSSRLQAATLALAETPDPIRVIDEPVVVEHPVSTRKTTDMLVAGVIGLLLGTMLAFFADYLQRVREREQLAVSEKATRIDNGREDAPSTLSQEDTDNTGIQQPDD
ncbi:GNVR domain-containing protein [Candidatus Bipolaricaulota bacterium]